MAKLRWLQSSVQNVTEGVPKRTAALVSVVVTGQFVGDSVVQSEIARGVAGQSKRSFWAVSMSLSRSLRSKTVHVEEVLTRYLEWAGAWTRRGYDVIVVEWILAHLGLPTAPPPLARARDPEPPKSAPIPYPPLGSSNRTVLQFFCAGAPYDLCVESAAIKPTAHGARGRTSACPRGVDVALSRAVGGRPRGPAGRDRRPGCAR